MKTVYRYPSALGTRVMIYLPSEVGQQVRELSRHYDISYSGMIRRMVIYWIGKHQKKVRTQ